jgi:LPXTG-site transpeptidase (sortase) family protein
MSVLISLPTVLLVAGAFLLGISSGSPQLASSQANAEMITDSELGLDTSSQYSDPSLIHSAPANFEKSDSRYGQPIRVNIDELSVRSRVIPVSSYGGVMEIPEDISKVGWYVGGSAPGDSQGAAVLVGHRDGVESGRGAFFGIEELNEGDRISVTSSEGIQLRYSVLGVDVVDKDSIEGIADSIFTKVGQPRLILITCGGAYEKEEGGYQSNVIVTAVPI